MEKKTIILFRSFPLLSVALPYYHYADKCFELMDSLSKNTKLMLSKNANALIRCCVKRELRLHYHSFKALTGSLLKCKRNELYKLRIQIKFVEDYDEIIKFLNDNPHTEFSCLDLVITEECLEKANELIYFLEEKGFISEEMDETYDILKSVNFGSAASMNTKLRYESKMMIGDDKKAFIDKVDRVGLLDVREVSRCPVKYIKFPVYKIIINKKFSDALMKEGSNYSEIFTNSVKKIVIEEDTNNISYRIARIISNTQRIFINAMRFELVLTQNVISADQIKTLMSQPVIDSIEYRGSVENE